MKIHVGTSGYAHKEWTGTFYPEKISPKEMLSFYSTRLGAVEINNTFYHMPTKPVLITWAKQVPDDFVIAIKAPRVITHIKRLKDVAEETAYLFRTLPALGWKLGPVLFQFPHYFHANHPVLEAFLELIPETIPCAFEFRSPSWHDDAIINLLRQKGCCLCIADTDENPAQDVINTAPWGYLRLRRSDYTDAALAKWLENITSQKWERAFVFFKHEGNARGPETAMHFRELVNARMETAGGKKKN